MSSGIKKHLNWFFTCILSIGSLGKGGSWSQVSDVMVDGASLSNTKNGVRIKTWQVSMLTTLHPLSLSLRTRIKIAFTIIKYDFFLYLSGRCWFRLEGYISEHDNEECEQSNNNKPILLRLSAAMSEPGRDLLATSFATFPKSLLAVCSRPNAAYLFWHLRLCESQTSAVKVENVSFIDIRGTSTKVVAIKFACSNSMPCEGLYLNDILLLSSKGKRTRSFCWEAYGSISGVVYPPVIIFPRDGFIKKPGLSESYSLR